MKIEVLNGPNLNLLGSREPEIYGYDTLADIEARCVDVGRRHGAEVTFYQSNHEGALIDRIHAARGTIDALVLNLGAYTHTSVALHDALRAYEGRKVELHISNPHLREPFRHVSFVGSASDAVVTGLGVGGYELVVESLAAS